MKLFLLSFLLSGASLLVQAQKKPLNNLPPGRYETVVSNTDSKWERGDIILIDAAHYRISSAEEVGEYRFSTTAQRIFFTSGPLRAVFARTINHSGKPAIELPYSENSHQHIAAADVLAVLRQ